MAINQRETGCALAATTSVFWLSHKFVCRDCVILMGPKETSSLLGGSLETSDEAHINFYYIPLKDSFFFKIDEALTVACWDFFTASSL